MRKAMLVKGGGLFGVLFLCLFGLVVVLLMCDFLARPVGSLFGLSKVNRGLAHEDWKVYPIGCHVIQLPDEYSLIGLYVKDEPVYWVVEKSALTVGENTNELVVGFDYLPSGEFSVEVFYKSSFLSIYDGFNFNFPYFVEFAMDELEWTLSAYGLFEYREFDQDEMVVREYYSGKGTKETTDALVLRQPLPLNGKFGVLFVDYHNGLKKDGQLMKEVANTLRIDQRLFGDLIDGHGELNSFDSMRLNYGIFEVGSLSVDEYDQLPQGMEQSVYWSHESRSCKDLTKSLVAPSRYIADYRGVIEMRSYE
ncbi:hypothetical protein [Lujinxingia litoralis]|uniref:hypothetical protein n=1 Tax=Lujinxingia litoralis TaxID=2211119 RepID=UPI0011B93F8C|nr:hypothetical protein [Lujinxingia litoralis]